MNYSKLLTGAIAGTIVAFVCSFLFFGIALGDYMTTEVAGKEPIEMHWLIIGQFLLSLLITYIFIQWAGIKTAAGGAKGALTIALLMSMGYNLCWLGTSNLFTGGIGPAMIDATWPQPRTMPN